MKVKAIHKQPPAQVFKKQNTYADFLRSLYDRMKKQGINCLEFEPEENEKGYLISARYTRACKNAGIPLKFDTVNGSVFVTVVY